MSADKPIPLLHLLHKWTRWSAPETVAYRMPRIRPAGESVDEQYFTFTRDEQKRTCIICGAEQVREVEASRPRLANQRHAS